HYPSKRYSLAPAGALQSRAVTHRQPGSDKRGLGSGSCRPYGYLPGMFISSSISTWRRCRASAGVSMLSSPTTLTAIKDRPVGKSRDGTRSDSPRETPPENRRCASGGRPMTHPEVGLVGSLFAVATFRPTTRPEYPRRQPGGGRVHGPR